MPGLWLMNGAFLMMTTVPCRRLAARLKVSTAAGLALLAISGTAALAQAVVVQGNRRVDAETIRGYAARGGSPEQIRQELVASGLFSSVRVTRRGSQTVIAVTENNSINNVAFEGNRRLRSEQLLPELQSKSRGPISDALINSDAQRIREFYRRGGYGNVQVTPRIVPLPNGRSDVVFTIVEGSKTGILVINFEGNQAYGDTRLKNLMTSTEMNLLSWFKTSDVYDPDKIASDLELVRRFYLRNGYADFRVVSNNARFDAERGGYVVDVVVSAAGCCGGGIASPRDQHDGRQCLQRRGCRALAVGDDDRDRPPRLPLRAGSPVRLAQYGQPDHRSGIHGR
jgi:outer membrane protein insertion porin family